MRERRVGARPQGRLLPLSPNLIYPILFTNPPLHAFFVAVFFPFYLIEFSLCFEGGVAVFSNVDCHLGFLRFVYIWCLRGGLTGILIQRYLLCWGKRACATSDLSYPDFCRVGGEVDVVSLEMHY